MRWILFFAIQFCLTAYGKEVVLKSHINFRRTPHFLNSTNVIGQFNKGVKLTVFEEKILPSGTVAYKVKDIHGQFGWIYGSQQLVTIHDQQTTEAAQTEVGMQAECSDCRQKVLNTNNIRAIKPIVAQIEYQNEAASVDITVASAKSDGGMISESAREVAQKLKEKNFNCNTEANWTQLHGVYCIGKVNKYSKPVRIFIPSKFEKNQKNIFQIFFHGLRQDKDGNKFDTFKINKDDTTGHADLGARLQEGGANNSIVIMPESNNASSTFIEELGQNNGQQFLSFVEKIEGLTTIKANKIGLAGHSNGYLPINTIMSYPAVRDRISDVAIFDGTYKSTQNILKWVNESSSRKVWISWAQKGDVVKSSQMFVDQVRNKNQVTTRITNVEGLDFSYNIHFDNIRLGGYANFLKQSEHIY